VRLEVDERRAQLLELGLSLFSARSYDAVSIDELAKAAGVSKGLLYHYFPTKRDLYVAGLRLASGRLLEQTAPDFTLAPEDRARRGLETYLDFVDRHGQAYVALMRGGIGSDPEVAEILEESRSTFVRRILSDVPPELAGGLLPLALRGWLGFVEATAIEWITHRAATRDQVVRLLVPLLFDVLQRAQG
jgi:AcrR family transcriptional regulator